MRRLLIIWVFLDLCLLAAGVLSIVVSVVFMAPRHLILSMIFEKINFRCEPARNVSRHQLIMIQSGSSSAASTSSRACCPSQPYCSRKTGRSCSRR
jgi:hypothetical protein